MPRPKICPNNAAAIGERTELSPQANSTASGGRDCGGIAGLKRNGFGLGGHFALGPLFEHDLFRIFSNLPSPAEALNQPARRYRQVVTGGFTQAGNRYPLFGIML